MGSESAWKTVDLNRLLFSVPVAMVHLISITIFKNCYILYRDKETITMSEDNYEGIPRNQIPWDPKIDYIKCTSCGKCVDFCHMAAFKSQEIESKKKTVVNPNRCVVFCRGCEDICPTGAISHPDEEETQKIIDELTKAK
jgi:formate hydrogenlyase subunit 6/NADH:ubiquinone oxidoreductase subunit I